MSIAASSASATPAVARRQLSATPLPTAARSSRTGPKPPVPLFRPSISESPEPEQRRKTQESEDESIQRFRMRSQSLVLDLDDNDDDLPSPSKLLNRKRSISRVAEEEEDV